MTFPPKYKVCCGIMGETADCGTLSQKRKNASLPQWEAGAILHIGIIIGGEVERLCRFAGILVYSSRQAFFDALPQ